MAELGQATMGAQAVVDAGGTGQYGRPQPPCSSLSPESADHLVALIARAAQAPTATIHLLEGDRLRLVAASGPTTRGASAPDATTPDPGRSVIADGLPVVITTMAPDGAPDDAPGYPTDGPAYVGYPIRDADRARSQASAPCWTTSHGDGNPNSSTAVDQGAQACTAFVVEQRSAAAPTTHAGLLAALLDSLQTGVAACDAHGRLVFSNAANEDLNGPLPGDTDLRAWTRHPCRHTGPSTRRGAADARPGRRTPPRRRDHVERPQQRPSMLLADAQPITDAAGELARRRGDAAGRHPPAHRRHAQRTAN